ncbi:MAG TPA: serine hydrolase domain-containing protein [Bryobacteraceae bacterium]|nr:serine hydrolase domain-containing protein [Bryobacteraceae bacterium]
MRTRICLLIALALALYAQVADSPAERLFRNWLTVFNGGQRDDIQKFYQEHYPSRAQAVDNMMRFRQSTGGFDFRKSESATATTFTALVQEHDGDRFARAVLEVDGEKPGEIKRLNLQVIPRPAEFALPRMSEAAALKEFRTKLDGWAAQDKFAGAVLVAHNGKPVFTAVYGLADREKKIPNKLTTRFRMGSMNKMFTATSILQLVQAGKIKLDDPLGKYLPDYPNKEVATKVTIHHLLTHTGGTGDIFGEEFTAHRLELKTLQDYVKMYGARGPRFEPGARFEYSNYGFVLLGLVVEKASGQDYYDYVRAHIFEPAGMTRSGSEPENVDVADRSKGYMNDGAGKKPNTETLPYRGTSAGGGYTTVEDLLRFANALTGHKLLDQGHTELLTTGKVAAGAGKYAYGFTDNVTDGVRSFGHGGGAPGMNGDLMIFPDSGYVVAALANMDQAASDAAQWIAARLPAK